jgi:hypothetical protein
MRSINEEKILNQRGLRGIPPPYPSPSGDCVIIVEKRRHSGEISHAPPGGVAPANG